MVAVRTVVEYLDSKDRSPFKRWFDSLATAAALKVTTALTRLAAGHNSTLKAVGQGVHEVKIDFGPGYRIYVGMDGQTLVVLLGGSSKSRQGNAIADAQERWPDYRQRKRRGA